MNRRNRHMQYRRSIYRRQRIRTAVIAISAVLILLIIGFLILGNFLQNQSDERNGSAKNSESDTQQANNNSHTEIREIGGYPILLETSDSSTFTFRLSQLKSKGFDTASVPLNTADGGLLYRSPIAVKLGMQIEGEYSVTIERAMQNAEAADVYISGTFYVTAFSEEDALLRSVTLSKETAILAEAFQGGIHDILLIIPNMTEENSSEVLGMIDRIRSLAADAAIGVALNDTILNSENLASMVDRLYSHADYLALDATRYGETDPARYIEEKVTGMLYYLLRYRMRVLLPESSDEALQRTWIAAAESNGMNNWQILSTIDSSSNQA